MQFPNTPGRTWLLPATLALGLIAALPAGAQNTYQFTELADEFGLERKAYAINVTGQIIGVSRDEDGTAHSVHWHNEVFTDLHGTVHFDLEHLFRLFNEGYSESFAISNGDQIVGTARVTIKCGEELITITNAFVSRPGVLTDLGTPYPGDALTNLGTFGHPCYVYDSAAVGISNNNHVVGWTDMDEGGTMHAFLVTPVGGKWYEDVDGDLVNDLMVDLGTMDTRSTASSATGVNDAGQITGWSYVSPALNNPDTGLPESGYHAFRIAPQDTDGDGLADRWFVDGGAGVKNDLMADLGTLGGNNSWGRDINNSGQVVGESDTASGTTRAFLWEDGVMIDLGVLDRTDSAGFRNSSASAINDAGHVVGWAEDETGERRAFVWIDGVMYDLNDHLLATDNPSFVLNEGRDINANGQVVGWGAIPGTDRNRSFLLTIATPAQIAAAEAAMNPPTEEEEEAEDQGDGAGGGASAGGTPIIGRPGNLIDTQTGAEGEEPPPAPALCGPGAVAVVPLTVLGLCCLRAGRSYRRRK
jgi:probable HAF family extracellular repeat protein